MDSLTPQDCGKKNTELNKLSPAPERQCGRIDIFQKQSSRMRRKNWRRKIRKEI